MPTCARAPGAQSQRTHHERGEKVRHGRVHAIDEHPLVAGERHAQLLGVLHGEQFERAIGSDSIARSHLMCPDRPNCRDRKRNHYEEPKYREHAPNPSEEEQISLSLLVHCTGHAAPFLSPGGDARLSRASISGKALKALHARLRAVDAGILLVALFLFSLEILDLFLLLGLRSAHWFQFFLGLVNG